MTRRIGADPPTPDKPKVVTIIPMKPRRGLFILSLCVFGLWVGMLLWMYFATVLPHRNQPPTRPRATAPALANGRG